MSVLDILVLPGTRDFTNGRFRSFFCQAWSASWFDLSWDLCLSTQNCRLVWSCNHLVLHFLWLTPIFRSVSWFWTFMSTFFATSSSFYRASFAFSFNRASIFISSICSTIWGGSCNNASFSSTSIFRIMYFIAILNNVGTSLSPCFNPDSVTKYLICFASLLKRILTRKISFAGTSNWDNILYSSSNQYCRMPVRI